MIEREDIIRWARKAGILETMGYGNPHMKAWQEDVVRELSHFAALVAAAEREACAKLCDEKVDAEYVTGKVDHNEMGWTQACAIAIRARGQE